MDPKKLKAARELKAQGSAGGADEIETPLSHVYPKPAALELGGRCFTLTPMSINELILIESEWGSSQAFFEAVETPDYSAIRFFAWLMLRKSAPELTADEAGELLPIRQGPLIAIVSKLIEASGLTDPNEPGATEEEADPEPTGNSSSDNS